MSTVSEEKYERIKNRYRREKKIGKGKKRKTWVFWEKVVQRNRVGGNGDDATTYLVTKRVRQKNSKKLGELKHLTSLEEEIKKDLVSSGERKRVSHLYFSKVVKDYKNCESQVVREKGEEREDGRLELS